VTRAFFALPLAQKNLTKGPPGGPNVGYAPVGSRSLAYGLGEQAPPDLNESFTMGRDELGDDDYYRGATAASFFAPNVWPGEPPAFRPVWRAYFGAMEGLAATLMRVFALALDLPEQFFDDTIDKHISKLRVHRYGEQVTEPLPGQLRAGAHTDYGSLTILRTDDAPGGLQVHHRRGEWIDVATIADSFVVNIGDLMMRWTNDRWISTLHRVVNPPRDQARGRARISVAFFHQPNYDAVISCLPTCRGADEPAKYPPITSGDYMRAKVRQTHFTAAQGASR
jgi:isopenicillin N synthase-like dioxygenase